MGVDTADNQLSFKSWLQIDGTRTCSKWYAWPLRKATTGEVSQLRWSKKKRNGPGIEIRAARSQLLSDFSVTAEVWDAKANKDLHSQTLHPLSKFAATCTFHGSSKLVDPAIKVMFAIQGQFPVSESSQLSPCDHVTMWKWPKRYRKVAQGVNMLFWSMVQSEIK